MTKPTFYLTTAIAYASGKPHFGNTYEAIMSDAVARFKREMGYDVFFCTGTDEHRRRSWTTPPAGSRLCGTG